MKTMLEISAGSQSADRRACCMQVLHVAGVAILDDAAREAAEVAAAAASRQAESAAEGGSDDAGPRMSRKEEKRQRRAERAAKLAQTARNGLPNGVSGELQVFINLR